MQKTFHFKKYSIVKGGVEVAINLDRFEKQFQRAQCYLDGQVMTDMVPLMPHNAGTFAQQTRADSAATQGSGKVYAAGGVQGRFLYGGKVMVDELTGSPWARKGAKKVVTDRNLKYSNPQAVPHWFDEAKKRHGAEWIKGVKKIAGGK